MCGCEHLLSTLTTSSMKSAQAIVDDSKRPEVVTRQHARGVHALGRRARAMDRLAYLHSCFQTGAATWQRWWQGDTQRPPTYMPCCMRVGGEEAGGELGGGRMGKVAVY